MAKKKPQVRMSFEESRRAILDNMIKHARGETTEKVIKFRNNDVPRFLKDLDAYEERSAKVVLRVG